MHKLIPLFITFITSCAFGQVFTNTSVNQSLHDEFKPAEDKSIDILNTSYPNLNRAERMDIKQTILQGSYLSDNLNRSGRVIFFGEAVEYLNKLKSTILAKYPIADSIIKIFITDDASLNAFATVDNRIYVNVGLLARVKTEGQLVYILCHEIMHIINHHIIGKSEEEETDATSVSKDKIMHNSEIKELDRHLQSQKDEFEADLDGFGLFSKLDYHPSEALRTIELLSSAETPILTPKHEAQSFFLDSDQFAELVENFNNYNLSDSTEVESTDGEEVLSTHPSIDERWKVLDSLISEKTIEGENTQSEQFLKITRAAFDRIPTIMAQDFNYTGLFQNASARYFEGNQSEQTVHSLSYALQGMYIDKLKDYSTKDQYFRNETDSLFHHFYNTSSEEELACWTYLTMLSLVNDQNAHVVSPFLKSLKSNITLMDSVIYRRILGDDTPPKKSDTPTGLQFDGIDFSISPYADLTPKQRQSFKKREGQGNYENGKIALLNTKAYRIRKDGVFSRNYSFDFNKGETLTNRSREAFIGLGENRDEILCLTPNAETYSSNDYTSYKSINNWLNEYYYLGGYEYETYFSEEMDSLIEKEGIRYAFSSLSVEVKSGSSTQFLLTYFSPFALPLYVPMLVVNTIIDGTRHFSLSIIVDLETKSLVFWDKRTSNEPTTSAIYYQNYDDVLNKFQANKKK